MDQQAEAIEDQVIQAEPEAEQVQDQGEKPELETQTEDDAGEVDYSIDGEAPAPKEEDEFKGPAPKWVKDLRKRNEEQAREIRDLKAKQDAQVKPVAPVSLGAKPTLSGCDYDESKFEAELSDWHAKKRSVDDKEAEAGRKLEAEKEAWNNRLNDYRQAATKLKVNNFQEAEQAAVDVLDQTQQGVILNGSDEPAKLVYVLGTNPKKLKELSSIKDPVKFAFAVAKLETQVKATPRKTPPAPESNVRGNAKSTGANDSTADRLLDQAVKTGNMTPYRQYMAERRAKG